MTGESCPVAGLDADVLVVGAGPVGLMLAGELRLGGASVIVVDRLAEPTGESRAAQLNARTAELFDQRDLLRRFPELERVPTGHFGGLGLRVDHCAGHLPGFWKVPQSVTEAVLAERAVELGADLRRGVELTGLRRCPGTGNVQADLAGGGALRAAYVVGCDGGASTVRRSAGIGFPGIAAERELLRADVAGIEVPDRRFERHEGGLAIANRRPDGVTRLMVHEFGVRPADRRSAPDFAEVADAWARVTGENVSGGTPLWVDSFDDRSHQAEVYRRDRVLLAGDAAHVQLPAGGQALNLGLADAVNLGWKLAAVVRGRAPEDVLDSYQAERLLEGARVLTNVRAQGLLLLGGPEVTAARAVFAEILAQPAAAGHVAEFVSGLAVRYPAAGGPPAGTALPRVELATGEGPTDTVALLRRARWLLLDMTGAPSGTARPYWADQVDHVPAKPQPGGVLDDIGAVLVRPDGHVAWCGDSLADPALAETARTWFARPSTHAQEEER